MNFDQIIMLYILISGIVANAWLTKLAIYRGLPALGWFMYCVFAAASWRKFARKLIAANGAQWVQDRYVSYWPVLRDMLRYGDQIFRYAGSAHWRGIGDWHVPEDLGYPGPEEQEEQFGKPTIQTSSADPLILDGGVQAWLCTGDSTRVADLLQLMRSYGVPAWVFHDEKRPEGLQAGLRWRESADTVRSVIPGEYLVLTPEVGFAPKDVDQVQKMIGDSLLEKKNV